MRLLYYSLSLFLSLTVPSSYAASDSPNESKPHAPCTVRSPSSGAFFDLNLLHIESPELSKAKHPRNYSWNTTGYDYPYNFTMNFCSGVIEPIEDVVGIEPKARRNVSAYYKQDGKVFSIGQQNSSPVFRGRKLVLNYTGGSPCGGPSNKLSQIPMSLGSREIIDPDDDDDKKSKKPSKGEDEDDDKKSKKPNKGDDDDDDERDPEDPKSSVRRKSTIISLLCERDPLQPLLTLSFVGADPYECTYFFEARSTAACGGIETAQQTLSPSGVFGVIVLIAVLVYLVGGCVYSRMVLQQRGWRQLPNYALWSGIFGFIKDLFIILTSSCARFLPSRRGYTRVNGGLSRDSRGRGSEDENRLIDQLDEEWED